MKTNKARKGVRKVGNKEQNNGKRNAMASPFTHIGQSTNIADLNTSSQLIMSQSMGILYLQNNGQNNVRPNDGLQQKQHTTITELFTKSTTVTFR